MVRIQVLLTEEEREAFRRQAEKDGVSLSSWLRNAGRQHLEASDTPRFKSSRELERFFAACRRRETGREPDWEEHEAVMRESRSRGGSRT